MVGEVVFCGMEHVSCVAMVTEFDCRGRGILLKYIETIRYCRSGNFLLKSFGGLMNPQKFIKQIF